MKKIFFCVSLVLTGLMSSCVDKYEEVPSDEKPSWLGGSIYSELQTPDQTKLTGTFNTYLRLVNDLGYSEIMDRTGSLTVFPANDEAFARFFASNDWGVSSYEELSSAQKNLLLKFSMLSNALLLEMLPNVSDGTADVSRGEAIKHATSVSVIDTIQHITSAAEMPQNNKFWQRFYDRNIDVVRDRTTPGIVHLTREYMIKNGITTQGTGSDFEILTGEPYTEGTAYIFNDRVINGDITCQNGYIHQVRDVIFPPGNMAEVIKRKSNTQLFSHMLDYFSAPVYDQGTTEAYNGWAKQNNQTMKDSIFEVRYLSEFSHTTNSDVAGGSFLQVPNSGVPTAQTTYVLKFDPGWNRYYPSASGVTTNQEINLKDIGAMIVPTDDAIKTYFLPANGSSNPMAGAGSFLIDEYGSLPNTEANLIENLDTLYKKSPDIIALFIRTLQMPSFASSVPSKFHTIPNDVNELLGVTLDNICKKDDGTYDITIANNGVVYFANTLLAPDTYQSVLAPARVYKDMNIMKWAVYDTQYLDVDFFYYLLAMGANYAFFIPEDKAFDYYMVDPVYLGHSLGQMMLHFYYDASANPALKCERFSYDPTTGTIGATPVQTNIQISSVKSQLVDLLNYHTVVLDAGEDVSKNHYYKTKHGGTVYVEGNFVGAKVMAGEAYDGNPNFPAPTIKAIYNEKNGKAYRMDRVIQGPHKSVYNILSNNSNFSKFLQLSMGFSATHLMRFAEISDVHPENNTALASELDTYTIFTKDYQANNPAPPKPDDKGVIDPQQQRKYESDLETLNLECIDYNVKMFNTYNYTLFAPDNTAMDIAYNDGLPSWSDVQELFDKWYSESDDLSENPSAEEKADRAKAKKMINAIRKFIRYHFINGSVYADNVIDAAGRAQTLLTNDMGVALEVNLGGGNGVLTVKDAQKTVSVYASDRGSSKVVNAMARDIWYDQKAVSATEINTSSFCAIHQISQPLCSNSNGSFSPEN